jgi:glycosyltransferase involved in cell wall biosynthesis
MAEHDPGKLQFVSVVIPVFNEERYIQACLDSVFRQDYPADRYEVMVADGGSTNRTRAIVASASERHPLGAADRQPRTDAGSWPESRNPREPGRVHSAPGWARRVVATSSTWNTPGRHRGQDSLAIA